MGINFIPGSEKDSERLKRKNSDNRDFEYTAGEDVRESALQGKKAEEEKKEKSSEPKKKKRKLSFFEWRTQKNQKELPSQYDSSLLSAQEQAEKDEAEQPEQKKVKKEKKRKVTSSSKKKSDAASRQKKQDMPAMHIAPIHDEDESPNLLDDVTGGERTEVKVQEEVILEEQDNEVDQVFHQDSIQSKQETKKEKKIVFNVPNKVEQDESPDLTHVRGEKADAHEVKKIAKKEAKKEGKPLKEVLPEKQKKKKRKKGESETEEIHLNLLPQEVLSEIRTTNNLRDLFYTAIGLVSVVLLINAGINFYEYKVELDTKSLENQLQQVETDITRFSPVQQEALLLEERLQALQEVLDQHIYWTPFLEELESITLPTVYYKSMAGSAQTGAFTFDVVATDFNQVEPQISLFQRSPYVVTVTSSGISQVADSSEEEETTTTTESDSEEESVQNTSDSETESENTEDTTTSEAPVNQQSVQFSLTVEFDTTIFYFQ